MPRHYALAFTFLAAVSLAAPVAAQTFPAKTVRIVIGVPPGGLSDSLARALASDLTKAWGQPVVVENRVGASDTVAAESVARSAADGHTLYQANGTLLMVNQLLRRNLPFDIDRDFMPVHGLVRSSDVLVVRPSLGVKSVADLVNLARAKPGALNFGSIGVGSGPHLSMAKLGVAAGFTATHIPYKGGADVAKGLLSGEIDFAFSGLGSLIGQVKQGQIQALAWGGPQRSAAIPDVPTLKEAGYTFDTGSWLGWLVPAATPRAVVERLSADVGRALSAPGVNDKLLPPLGLEPLNIAQPQFAALMKQTRSEYATLFSKVEVKLD